MPQRPRPHQLEDESRAEFRRALPPSWVFRDAVPDYGIDGQLEVFDEDGSATGLMCLVQLKATDRTELSDALTLSLRTETLDYYRSLDLPVLLACYVAPLGKFYWCWVHEIRIPKVARDSKTVTVRVPDSREWTAGTPARIRADLLTFRKLKSPSTPLPIEFGVTIVAETIRGMPSGLIVARLKEAAARLQGVLTFSEAPAEGARPELTISDEKVVADWAGLASLTISFPNRQGANAFIRIPEDLIIMIALVIGRVGHPGVAAQIVAPVLGGGTLPLVCPELIFGVFALLAKAGRMTEAFDWLDRALASKQAMSFLNHAMLAANVFRTGMSAAERECFCRFQLRVSQFAAKNGLTDVAATAHYNLGNELRSRGRAHARAALTQYRLAARCDSSYRERAYFWNELGGILFLLGRFHRSASAYERALRAEGNRLTRLLHADALMFAGKYKEARDRFHRSLEERSEYDDEWILKEALLDDLVERMGLVEQVRRIGEANRLADVTNLPADEAATRLREALQLDGLCSFAWFNLGVLQNAKGDSAGARDAFLAAGLSVPWDLEAWVNAVLVSFNLSSKSRDENVAFMILAARVAYWLNGNEFLELLNKRVAEQVSGPMLPVFINTISQIAMSSRSACRHGLVIRVIGEGNKYESFDMA